MRCWRRDKCLDDDECKSGWLRAGYRRGGISCREALRKLGRCVPTFFSLSLLHDINKFHRIAVPINCVASLICCNTSNVRVQVNSIYFAVHLPLLSVLTLYYFAACVGKKRNGGELCESASLRSVKLYNYSSYISSYSWTASISARLEVR